MAEVDLQEAPLGVEAQRGKEVWAGTVAAADGEPAWAAFAQCWTSGRVGRLWATTGAAWPLSCTRHTMLAPQLLNGAL